jgi:hypothetical protein
MNLRLFRPGCVHWPILTGHLYVFTLKVAFFRFCVLHYEKKQRVVLAQERTVQRHQKPSNGAWFPLTASLGEYQIRWISSRINEAKNTGLDFCQVLCRFMGMRGAEPRKNRHIEI